MGAKQTVRDKKKGRTREPFVMIISSWMDLPAWKHLNGNAVNLLLHMIRLSGGDNGAGSTRGEMFLSERDAAKAIGVAKGTASVALSLLEEAGWIRAVNKGHFAVKAGEKVLRATVWRLTFQPHPQSRRGPTMEFRNWKPGEKPRGQKLTGPGSELDPLNEDEVKSGSNIGADPEPLPSEANFSSRSKTDPHLDIAKGGRNEGADVGADPASVGSYTAPGLQERFAGHWQNLHSSPHLRTIPRHTGAAFKGDCWRGGKWSPTHWTVMGASDGEG